MSRYPELINQVLVTYQQFPIDMLGLGEQDSEITYLKNLAESYARTTQDIDQCLATTRPGGAVLEIGSYLGVVSRSLKELGYDVHACDHPTYHASASLRAMYERNGIPFKAVDLSTGDLPFESEQFDAVIICEVIEHLNFNPLPIIRQINRVLKKGGVLYIGMPNHASLANRLRLLRGQSIHNPISDLLLQLDTRTNMSVGLHWREYTAAETSEMVEKMGFTVTSVSHFLPSQYLQTSPIKKLVKRLIYSVPTLRPFQVVVSKKRELPEFDHWRN